MDEKLLAFFKSKGWKKGDPCCGGRGLASGCPVCKKVWGK